MKEDKPGDWEIVTAYKRLLNSEDGVKVLDHLKAICRFNDHAFNYDIGMERMSAMHYTTRIINYMEYMRDREPLKTPTDKDPLDLGIKNEL